MSRRGAHCETVLVDGAAVRIRREGRKPLTPRDVAALEELVRAVRSMVSAAEFRRRAAAWYARSG